MNARRILVSIVVSLILLLGLAPMAYAAEDDVTGSFTTANVVPDVIVMEIYSDAGLTIFTNSLTPQVMYYIRVTAGDPNTIDDIDEIEVQVFYDATGSDPVAPGVANTQTAAIFFSGIRTVAVVSGQSRLALGPAGQ